MIVPKLVEIEKSELSLSEQELYARLGKIDFERDDFLLCQKKIFESIEPRVAYLPLEIVREGDIITIGEIKTESKALRRTLSGYTDCVIFALTLGARVDREIRGGAALSNLYGFILDGISSAYAEALCEICETKIKENLSLSARQCLSFGRRFSPGYSDLELEVNKPLLNMLQSDKSLGIYLLDSLIMSPRKSITAIMGMK